MDSRQGGGLGRGGRPEAASGDIRRRGRAPAWFGGAPCARVVDPETDEAEVVPIFRITPRDE